MNPLYHDPPVIGFAARSGTGKTTLLEKLLPVLVQRGLRPGVIKHSHHDFAIDVPGKDSDRLRRAGAVQTLIASPWREVWIRERGGEGEPRLEDLLARLDRAGLDLILVEGFRHLPFPRIEVVRQAAGGTPLYPTDDCIVAVVTDRPLDTALPQIDLDDPAALADYLIESLALQPEGKLP
ncbi:MAG TPA: molybdopterin-guanine dinucleotide biosynthesis protein B [Gammaproteobacteria bacterium]|nr:molybdopterin-guanine dinucleotide biosynthesis protein B [Gammaproteobacteria bacterium]